MKGFIEPTREISSQQRAIRQLPYNQRWAFWKRQAEGNAAEAQRNLNEQWRERDDRSSQARQAIIQFHKETDNNDRASNFVTPRYVPDYLTNEGGVGGSSISPGDKQTREK